MPDINSLSYLIPTGDKDIAVREILVKIFGDAVACKIPLPAGADPICNTLNSADAAVSNGGLVSTVFSVFNVGTLVFATILLIFIGLLVFVRTAQDGEFMGKSWNTTFTALRLVAGIGFILPMPNGYSMIQNFVMYVGLWSSGLANETNVKVADHYLKRLQTNMVKQDPTAASIRQEAQTIFAMHLCASSAQAIYGQGGMSANAIAPDFANLKIRKSSTSTPFDNVTGTTMDALGNITNGGSFVATDSFSPKDRIELAYVENGTFFSPKGSAPCGKIIVEPLGDLRNNIRINPEGDPEGSWGAALNAYPLTVKARTAIMKSVQDVADNGRDAKIRALATLMAADAPGNASSGGFNLKTLADSVVSALLVQEIKYGNDGRPIAGGPPVSAVNYQTMVLAYAAIVNKVDADFNKAMDDYRNQELNKAKDESGEGSFFALANDALKNGGWMGTAATYRMMLDMTSIYLKSNNESSFKTTPPDLVKLAQGWPTFGAHYRNIQGNVDGQLGSDYALTALAPKRTSSAPVASTPKVVTTKDISKLASTTSLNDAIEIIYGTTSLDGLRNSIVKSASLSDNYDPLFQMKSIGDMATLASEGLIVGEFTFRSIAALSKATAQTAKAEIIGAVGDAIVPVGTGIVSFADASMYIADQLFSITRALTVALSAIGYMFSTWIPAIPYMAFLLASLGWVFGLTMTLFAVNMWGVMHLTPARNDSFIGSEVQGYLLLAALFFRPVIAVSALSLSYVMAPPIVRLVNMTLFPMLFTNNVSTNTLSIIFATVFGLVLYFAVIKAVLVMVFMIPQAFPDEVMRIISAGIGDLGQSKGLSAMEASEGSGSHAQKSVDAISVASSEGFRGTIKHRQERAKKDAADAAKKAKQAESSSTETEGLPGITAG